MNFLGFKSIVRQFEFGDVKWLIRSGIINWSSGKFFFIIFVIKSQERSIKPFTAAKDFWDGFIQSK
jgi:hypothetical protein